MTPTRPADRELDNLIDEITIDCYDEDEALMGFENAFDEDAHLPRPGSILGEPVEVISIGPRAGRRELIASCQHAGQRHDIALLDVKIDADPALSRLIAAYRRWDAFSPSEGAGVGLGWLQLLAASRDQRSGALKILTHRLPRQSVPGQRRRRRL